MLTNVENQGQKGEASSEQAQGRMLTNVEIQEVIPHRYPFLLVDRIIDVEPGKKAVGIKNISAGESCFLGHFPGMPIFPGVLIVEALAQTAGIATGLMEEHKGKIGFFTGVENMKFKKQVVPGDTLLLTAEVIAIKLGVAKFRVVASVGNQVAAEGEIKFAITGARWK